MGYQGNPYIADGCTGKYLLVSVSLMCMELHGFQLKLVLTELNYTQFGHLGSWYVLIMGKLIVTFLKRTNF